MTSLKDPFSEHGDTSPDLDVLTGSPAAPAVASDVAPAAPDPLREQPPESKPEPAPFVETAAAEPPPSAELPIDAAEPVTPHAETPEVPNQVAGAPVFAATTPLPAAEPPPLPDTPAPTPALEIPMPHVVPAIASAIAAPAAIALDAPTQPAPTLPQLTATAKPARAWWRVWLRRAVLAFISLAVGYAALILILIGVYRTVDPPRSTVMIGLNLSGVSVDYEPVPLSSISTYLQRAVIASEDARFCRHGGVDWAALAEAVQDSRGGSTITMQTAKNLFLWPSRSYIRKAIEIPVALLIDFAWPKRRILEVYLNIAEWGPGVFGAEAAAQYHFGKPASRLTQNEATLLAASLPNPIAREAGDPGRVTALLAGRLRARMANSDAYVTCLGLRPMPRAEQEQVPKSAPSSAAKAAPKTLPWQTKTEPAKPPTPFNPWQN